MKTKNFISNNAKTAIAIVTASVVTMMGMTACSADCEEDLLAPVPTMTRGGGPAPVSYVERSWDGKQVVSTVKTVTDYIELKGSDMTDYSSYELQSDKWYVVKSNFERCFINAPSGKPANLIICNGARVFAGVMIDEGDALNIYSQEGDGGELRATAADDRVNHWKYPGIGSRRTMGTLTIHGGKITAISKGIEEIAAIGGGNKGSGGKVTIYGGNITADGGDYGAGIGSGYGAYKMESLFDRRPRNDGGTLTIYGGNVTAKGGKYGAGIGGGIDANGATVTIYGGKVRATGGVDAAGIGSGEEQDVAPNIHGGSLTVYGGEVFADGTDWGAGIGGGEDADGAKVEIYGGSVTAWAGQDAGKKNGSAIGSEDGDGHRGSLKLGDNMKVWAGQNPSDADKHLFPFETRVPACFFRPYTRIVAGR